MHQSGPVIIAQRPCTKDWRWPSTLWTRRISTLLARISLSLSTFVMYYQGRNHVFKVGGPIPWSRVHCITTLLQKKLDRSTQFGAVGYIITLFITKLHENLGVRLIFGGPDPPRPPVVAPMCITLYALVWDCLYTRKYVSLYEWKIYGSNYSRVPSTGDMYANHC